MSIIYALISRGSQVLAEFAISGLTGNFSTVTTVLLKKIPDEDGKLSYIYDKYVFHYMVSDGLTYLCMADQEFPRLVSFQFLEDIRTRFKATYGDRGKTAIALSLNSDFQRVLQQQMERYNNMKTDKVQKVKEEISAVKDVMIKNIDKVLERGEKIELLVGKTEVLDQHAVKFKKQSRQLKNSMWWKNVKLILVLVLLVLVIIYVIIASQCGAALKCGKDKN
jgi:vesicle-associated membrane protein 7